MSQNTAQNIVIKMNIGKEDWYINVASIIKLSTYLEKSSSSSSIEEYPYKLEIRYSKDHRDCIGCSDEHERDRLMAVLLKYMGNVVDADEEASEIQQQAQDDYDPMSAIK